ncbi:MAG: YraN family protein [Firmicutes bacterium]|nr:YraN family protein [Bacillota bacterium]
MYKKSVGAFGEMIAEKHLIKKKYKIIDKNFYIRGGEIDIIAQKGEYLVFVEVKTRSSNKFGSAAEAVDFYKKTRMIKAAKVFLQRYGNAYARFDVIEVYITSNSTKLVADKISHIENAFME